MNEYLLKEIASGKIRTFGQKLDVFEAVKSGAYTFVDNNPELDVIKLAIKKVEREAKAKELGLSEDSEQSSRDAIESVSTTTLDKEAKEEIKPKKGIKRKIVK